MKRWIWVIPIVAVVFLILLYVSFRERAAKENHEGHGTQEQTKGEGPGMKGMAMESMEKEEKKAEAPPGTVEISPERQQLIGVKMGKVEKKHVEKVIRTTGRVDYDEKRVVTFSPKIGGWVEELYVNFTGVSVKKGDPLLTIYSPELVITQEEYLVALRAKRDLVKSPFPEVAASGQSLAESAKRRLALWDISDEQIRALEESGQPRKTLTLYSPYEGVVLEKMVYKGMNVMPGMALFKLADLSVVWIYADIYEYELSYFRLGQLASIALPYIPGKVFTGKVTYIYPSLDPKTRTARVRFEIPNPDGKLKPEMYADVSFKMDMGKMLVVPEGAIINTGVRQVAIVHKGAGRFEPREVKVGMKSDGYYEVTNGLSPGEQVVTSANFLIDAESKFKEALSGMGGMAGMKH